nr:2TM domain-containing protein [Vibrio viridaestus]
MIRKFRLQRGWSQEQLAEFSGLSIRTIQRLERGQTASLESLKSLAAAFDVQLSDLQGTETMNVNEKELAQENAAIEKVREIKSFYTNLLTYVVVIAMLFIINIATDPDYLWAFWPALGWGIGIISHALSTFEVFNLFSANWERKQVEKRLGRKL